MKVGLVLSGGGARAISHLGIIKAMEEEGIIFHAVSGVSAGALAGAFYCAGYTTEAICEILVRTTFLKAFRPAFNWRSLLNLQRASVELKKYFPEDDFSTLKKPLWITTTDLARGKIKIYKKGELIKPILASCSIPVIFDPVQIGKRTLVDGGILDNLPIAPIKNEVDKIVGLHCNPIDPGFVPGSWQNLMDRSIMLTATTLVHTKRKRCDLFLEPPGLCKFTIFDFKKVREIYQFGYEYARKQIAKGVLENLKG